MNEIIVDDHLVPAALQDEVESILTDSYFPWYLTEFRNSTCPDFLKEHFKQYTKKIIEGPQFVHQFVVDGKENSGFSTCLNEVGNLAINKYNLPYNISRIKANFCTNIYNNHQGFHQTPHTDSKKHHIGMIYYVNDCDGDTFFFKEKNINNDLLLIRDLNIETQIPPKKGRVVIFDGAKLHAGSYPILSNERLIVNFNFV